MSRQKRRDRKGRNLKLVVNNRGPKVDISGIIKKVEAPNDEKVLLKTVPANVDMEDGSPKIVVGKALIYDDGSVDIMIDEDADPAAVAKIKATEEEFGYSIGTE